MFLKKLDLSLNFDLAYCGMIYETVVHRLQLINFVSFRSTAVNFGSAFARVGSMIAALIAMLHLLSPALPYIVYGLLAGSAG